MARRVLAALAFVSFTFGSGGAGAAGDLVLMRNAAQKFALLPGEVRFPEGITGNPATGEMFVGTFDFGPHANMLLRLGRNGQLITQRDFGAAPLLGMAFHASDASVYIANFGASMIQRIPTGFGSATAIEDVASIPSIGAPGPRMVANPDTSEDTILFGSTGFPPSPSFGADAG